MLPVMSCSCQCILCRTVTLSPRWQCDKTFTLLLWNVKLNHMLFHRYKSHITTNVFWWAKTVQQAAGSSVWMKKKLQEGGGKKKKRKKEVGLRWFSASGTADGKSLVKKTQIYEGKHLQPFMLLMLEYNKTLSIRALNLTWGHSRDAIKVMPKKWKKSQTKNKKMNTTAMFDVSLAWQMVHQTRINSNNKKERKTKILQRANEL